MPSGADPKPVARTPRGRKALKRTYTKRHLPENRADWVQRRDAWLVEHPACFVRYDVTTLGVCWGPLDVHHIQPRGAGGAKNDDSPLVTLCRKHHEFAEQHRAWAREVGLLLRPWDEVKP